MLFAHSLREVFTIILVYIFTRSLYISDIRISLSLANYVVILIVS